MVSISFESICRQLFCHSDNLLHRPITPTTPASNMVVEVLVERTLNLESADIDPPSDRRVPQELLARGCGEAGALGVMVGFISPHNGCRWCDCHA